MLSQKRGMFSVGAAALLASVTAANASSVAWEGHTWDTSFGSAAVDGSNNLNVTATTVSSGTYYGDAHYNTDAAFRALATPFIQVTFNDTLDPNGGGYLAFEQESGANRSWAEIGVDPTNGATGASDYTYFWWNEATNTTDVVDLGARTSGDHTFGISRESNGTVDFSLDGALVGSTNAITPDYFGDVYLFAASNQTGSVATFTGFQAGVAPLPSAAAMGFGILGVLLAGGLLRKKLGMV